MLSRKFLGLTKFEPKNSKNISKLRRFFIDPKFIFRRKVSDARNSIKGTVNEKPKGKKQDCKKTS